MSSLFAGLKEKLADKLAEFRSSPAADDPNEVKAAKVVEEATSDILIAPDWGANLNVVDFLNSNVCTNSGLILKAIKRCLDKPNIKVQLLSLTVSGHKLPPTPGAFTYKSGVCNAFLTYVVTGVMRQELPAGVSHTARYIRVMDRCCKACRGYKHQPGAPAATACYLTTQMVTPLIMCLSRNGQRRCTHR